MKKTSKLQKRKQRNENYYCKQIIFSKSVDIDKGGKSKVEKCEIRISTLKKSLEYFQELFSGLGVIGKKADELAGDIYGCIHELESYIEKYRESDNLIDLEGFLKDSANSFDETLDSSSTCLARANQLHYTKENSQTDKLLEALETKFEAEFKCVKNVVRDLYNVLIDSV